MAYATEDALGRIVGEVLHSGNRATLELYLAERRANGIKLPTLMNEANHLRAFAGFLGERSFETTTKEDVRRFISQRATMRRYRSGERVTSRPTELSASTLNVRKGILKAFIRWLRGTEDWPPEVRWLKNTRKREEDSLPVEQVLTRDELAQLIEAQDHVQHKAIIATLYDSGCRASEFVSLRIRDVTLDQYGAVLTLPKGAKGLKTGARRIRVLQCTPYLRAWLNAHPLKRDPNAKLWISYANRNHGDPLTASALYNLVRNTGRRLNLTKELWPHLFRHSRATECAREGWPEAEMRNYFGWSKSSDMPSHYVHLSGKDYEENMLRRAGKLGVNHRPEPVLAVRVCQCGHENPATADYCEKRECGKPLTVAAAEKREHAQFSSLLKAMEQDEASLERLAATLLAKSNSLARTKGDSDTEG